MIADIVSNSPSLFDCAVFTKRKRRWLKNLSDSEKLMREAELKRNKKTAKDRYQRTRYLPKEEKEIAKRLRAVERAEESAERKRLAKIKLAEEMKSHDIIEMSKDPGFPDPFYAHGENRQFFNLGDGCRHIRHHAPS